MLEAQSVQLQLSLLLQCYWFFFFDRISYFRCRHQVCYQSLPKYQLSHFLNEFDFISFRYYNYLVFLLQQIYSSIKDCQPTYFPSFFQIGLLRHPQMQKHHMDLEKCQVFLFHHSISSFRSIGYLL